MSVYQVELDRKFVRGSTPRGGLRPQVCLSTFTKLQKSPVTLGNQQETGTTKIRPELCEFGFWCAFCRLIDRSPVKEVGGPFYRCKRPTRTWKHFTDKAVSSIMR